MVDIEKFKSLGFNKSQLKQIEKGISSGLSETDVERLAKKEYPSTKMERVREALEYGFTDEQIELYSDKKYDSSDAYEIRKGFENGLNVDDVKLYLNSNCVYRNQRAAARELIEDCNKGSFNEMQAHQIRLGMIHGVSMKDILKYANPEYSHFKMLYMRLAFENNLSKEQMKILDSAVSDLTVLGQIDEILNGLIHHLTNEQVLKYAKKGYGSFFMRQIRLAYEHGCTEEQVDYLIHKIDTKYNNEYVYWAKYPEDEERPNPYKLDAFKYTDNHHGWNMAFELRQYLEFGLPLESVKKVFDNIRHYNNVRLIRLALFSGYPFDEIVNVFYSHDCEGDNKRDVMYHAIANKLPIEGLELMLNWEFDYLQMIEILEGFLAKLSLEQIKIYALAEYDYLQMAEIRAGFICGLSMEQVKQYANPELTSVEMALKRAEILKAK